MVWATMATSIGEREMIHYTIDNILQGIEKTDTNMETWNILHFSLSVITF